MSKPSQSKTYDTIVIGAGFAGMYMLHRLRQLGMSARVYEAGENVGGTWFWNCYPGARCDVESMQYSYSFMEDLQQEWVWSERYPSQSEILNYINHVANRLDLRLDIQCNTRVIAAHFDAASKLWSVSTDQGDDVKARFVITATGCLSAARVPDMAGLVSFKGKCYHTGQWPKNDVDFSGQRVAVIGTGSSGIQLIPQVAQQASSLTVFQRTANFSVPALNRPLPVEEQNAWKAQYADYRVKARHTRSGILYDYSSRATFDVSTEELNAEYERRWAKGGANFIHAFNDSFSNRASNELAAEFVRNKIRGIVKDPYVAEMLCPKDHAIGTKRICVDTNFYVTFNLPHVKLVDLRAQAIQHIDENGIQTSAKHHAFDSIVFATGYDAITGAIDQIDIRNHHGVSLRDKWKQGPRTYLGLMTYGFPNLLFITGPGSPSVLSNVIVSIEQHVDLIARILAQMQSDKTALVEPLLSYEDQSVAHLAALAAMTLFADAPSWYTGANIPGKTKVFVPYIGGVGTYRALCEDVICDDYRGFQFSNEVNT
jgi:cyclohexanone monooxygenase